MLQPMTSDWLPPTLPVHGLTSTMTAILYGGERERASPSVVSRCNTVLGMLLTHQPWLFYIPISWNINISLYSANVKALYFECIFLSSFIENCCVGFIQSILFLIKDRNDLWIGFWRLCKCFDESFIPFKFY